MLCQSHAVQDASAAGAVCPAAPGGLPQQRTWTVDAPKSLALPHLASFLAVVRHGTVTGAAREMNYTQPAVTLHLQALERCLDTALFSREGGRLELTAEGCRLVGYAEQILLLVADAHSATRSIPRT